MDDQYWIKKYLAPTASHGCRWHADLPAACRGSCMSSSGRPQHGRGASLDHEVALPKQCRPTASYSWSGPREVCPPGPGCFRGNAFPDPAF